MSDEANPKPFGRGVLLVMHHGFLGFGNVGVGPVRIRYFAGRLEQRLRDVGFDLLPTRVHPTAGIATRAAQLREAIIDHLRKRPADRIVLLGHSMGGLDSRHLVSSLDRSLPVQAIVTLGTPHRGSPYADRVMRDLGERLGAAKLAGRLGIEFGAIADLTTTAMRQFNDETPNRDDVRYLSVAGARPWHALPPFFIPSWRVVHAAEGENDGLVSVASATWGRFLGTWPVDHLHLINKRWTPTALHPRGEMSDRYLELLRHAVR